VVQAEIAMWRSAELADTMKNKKVSKRMNPKRFLGAALALLWAGLAAVSHGDTILVVVEEFRDGEPLEQPLASQEGLMSGMFDLGHITFETGLYRPQMNWDDLDFAEPLRLAREGLARYLAVAQVFADLLPPSDSASSLPAGVEITVRANYMLFDAGSGRLIGRGDLSGSSTAGERDLRYDQFLFMTGERLARRITELLPESRSR
jgi:hypothetical protein